MTFVFLGTLLAFPLTVFWHEVGHALVALVLTRGSVQMVAGFEGPGFRMSLRRLTVWVGTRGGGGYCLHEDTTPGRSALIAAAGPAATLVLAVLALGLNRTLLPGDGLVDDLLLGAVIANLFTLLATVYPDSRRDGHGQVWTSDGLLVIKALWPDSRLARQPPRPPRPRQQRPWYSFRPRVLLLLVPPLAITVYAVIGWATA